MTDASFGSLSPRLLARKGGAKPAMRSQMAMLGATSGDMGQADLEDLGWNDLGDDAAAGAVSAEIIAIGSARAKNTEAAGTDAIRSSVSAPLRMSSRHKADRAAFTLRLDADRHLKLRLACTVRHCSAQQLVTDALDALLAGMPDIQKLAAQVGSK